MLEIIHDIAPGANLFFSGPDTSLEMIESIKFCAGSSHVTVDDLGFRAEPYFEDGPVAQEARNIAEQGKVFISAGGNDAMLHYQAPYVDTNPGTDADNHDFGLASGVESQTFLPAGIFPGETTLIVLQWNDPSFGDTQDGTGGSSNDYDLFIVPSTPNFQCPLGSVEIDGLVVCPSISTQDGDDDPIEAVVITNTSQTDPLIVGIVIDRFSGETRILEMFINPTGQFLDFNIAEDSIFGHPAVPDVIAVGAVPFSDPFSVEPFSSQGPSTIFFPAFEERPKPDVVAPNRVSVTGAGGFGIPVARSIFPGTSAAAPHVAGVAALLLEANPNLTPSEVKDALTNTAINLESASFAASLSRNDVSGFGLVDAFAAVQSVVEAPPTPTPTPTPTVTDSICIEDQDCPVGTICDVGTGLCITPPSPTAIPTVVDRHGDSNGGCNIGGSSHAGIALINILIPLVPAFAVGVRMIRRRKNTMASKSHVDRLLPRS